MIVNHWLHIVCNTVFGSSCAQKEVYCCLLPPHGISTFPTTTIEHIMDLCVKQLFHLFRPDNAIISFTMLWSVHRCPTPRQSSSSSPRIMGSGLEGNSHKINDQDCTVMRTSLSLHEHRPIHPNIMRTMSEGSKNKNTNYTLGYFCFYAETFSHLCAASQFAIQDDYSVQCLRW